MIKKSIRSKEGAEHWIQAMGVENVQVVDTDTLKSMYPEYAEVAPEFGYHVIEVTAEPCVDEVIEMVSTVEDDVELVRAFLKAGFAEVTEFGIELTDRWFDATERLHKLAMEDILKSTTAEEGKNVSEEEESDDETKKSTETVPENTEIGYQGPKEDKPISDEEADKANEETLPTPESEPADPAPEAITDADVEDGPGDVVKGLTFKSLHEARHWRNPDTSKYFVRTTNAVERRTLGARFTHIVDVKPETPKALPFGNRPAK